MERTLDSLNGSNAAPHRGPVSASDRRTPPAEAGIAEALEALRRRWMVLAAIALSTLAGAVAYVESMPTQYDGEAVVAFAPRPEVGIDAVRVVVPKYVAYADAPATTRRLARELGEDAQELERAVTIAIARDTGNVTVVARRPERARAATAANAVAAAIVDRAEEDPLLTSEIVAAAVTPREPSAPPRRLLEAAALIVALLVAIGATLLLERARPRVHSWREIAPRTGYPVVGKVPELRALRSRPAAAFGDPRVADAFRALRATLEPALPGADPVLVTSPCAGDGRTTVAALLVEAICRPGGRALLIDADLRSPGVAALAAVDSRPGLADVLRADADPAHAVVPGWVKGASVLPTAAEPHGGDLVAGQLRALVDAVRVDHETLVVDAPPLLGPDGPNTLAATGGRVLLVVASGTPVAALEDAVAVLESLELPMLGIVANRLRRRDT